MKRLKLKFHCLLATEKRKREQFARGFLPISSAILTKSTRLSGLLTPFATNEKLLNNALRYLWPIAKHMEDRQVAEWCLNKFAKQFAPKLIIATLATTSSTGLDLVCFHVFFKHSCLLDPLRTLRTF